MDTRIKLYVAGGVLAALAAVAVWQNQEHSQEQEAHSLQARIKSLPDLKVNADRMKTVDRVVLRKAGAAQSEEVELKKTGEESWELVRPLAAKAGASNVQSLLDNVAKLQLTEAISSGNADYDRWGVSPEKALHVQLFAGTEAVVDLHLGESGSRGQMVRVEGSDGVFALKGFSKWLYERDAKGFRDKTVFKFEDKDVVTVKVQNASGTYLFEKDGDTWKAKLTDKSGKAKPIDKFSPAKVDDMLRAYKALNAVDFGDGKAAADTGLAKPQATVSIELTGGTGHFELKVGDKADGTNRWAVSNASEQIYSIGSWSADWALADPSKFQGSS